QFETDHFGGEHIHRLAEHGRFGLDAAHAPTDHAQAVDQGRVRVGTYQGVGKGDHFAVFFTGQHNLSQILQVHLVHNTGSWRNNLEVVEGALPPVQELVALAVALKLSFSVELQRFGYGEEVHLHRVVDHQVDRHQGV